MVGFSVAVIAVLVVVCVCFDFDDDVCGFRVMRWLVVIVYRL